MSIWLTMSLVLSNAFKGVLLNSYVNIKYDLTIKSLNELINQPKITVFSDDFFKYIKDKTLEITKLEQRLKNKTPDKITSNAITAITVNEELRKVQTGQAVLLCHSFNCPLYIISNPHIQFIYTDDHYFHSFLTLSVRKSHSHSNQIYKL